MRPARSAIASCSSLRLKSTNRLRTPGRRGPYRGHGAPTFVSCSLPSVPGNSWEAKAEQGDEVALHLVGAAAERQDQRSLHGALDPAGERGIGLALAELATGAHDFEQQPIRLGEELGAEDLGRAGDARVHLPGAHLPVDELEVLGLRSNATQVQLHPLLV